MCTCFLPRDLWTLLMAVWACRFQFLLSCCSYFWLVTGFFSVTFFSNSSKYQSVRNFSSHPLESYFGQVRTLAFRCVCRTLLYIQIIIIYTSLYITTTHFLVTVSSSSFSTARCCYGDRK